MSISEDLILVRETLNNIQTLKKKYPKFTIERLVDALEISEKYGIPLDEIRDYCGFELVDKYRDFKFYFCHGDKLLNRETFYKFDTSKWYIRLTFGGCGRFNFVTDSRCLSERYAVTISDDVKMNEFADNYTIVEQKGNVYIIEVKDNEHD